MHGRFSIIGGTCPGCPPKLAFDSLWPKSLTPHIWRSHLDLEIKMLKENQLRLQLRLLVILCLLYPLPLIYLDLSWKNQCVVSNCKHSTNVFFWNNASLDAILGFFKARGEFSRTFSTLFYPDFRTYTENFSLLRAISSILTKADKNLFRSIITNPSHVLYRHLPKVKTTG